MSRFTPIALLIAGALVVGVGCNKDDKDHSSKDKAKVTDKSGKTLYERLGGKPAIEAVVKDFVGRGAANPKVNFTRQGKPNQWDPTPANVAKLETRLVEFISMATGGPKAYKGKDMVASHTGMQITNAEFDALAADLGASLDKFKVPKKEKDELIAIVASTRGEIVGK